MKHILHINKFLKFFIVLLSFSSFVNAQNLLTNGDFEAATQVGNGFEVGAGYSLITVPTGSTIQGNFGFTTNPAPFNSVFVTTGDHTTGTGNMMFVDGSSVSGSRFWIAGNAVSGLCGLTVGVTYKFSYWIKTISTTSTSTSTFTNAQIATNFTNTNFLTAQIQNVPSYIATGNNWLRVEYTFVPTSTCVKIELSNGGTGATGNDFAIDDLQVLAPVPPLSLASSFINPTCTTTNDGSIVLYAVSGQTPFTFNLTGAATLSNSNGIFTNLAPGIYNTSITDAAATTVNGTPITIVEPKLLVSPTDNLFCPTQSANLTVSGGTSYAWTSNPIDVTLTTQNNIFNPVVTPLVSTVYSVTSSTPATKELIYNGDFSKGNVGFTTDYQYLNPTNTAVAQGKYGIVNNPSSWVSSFSSCGDHTNGTGNMMVVDGSINNAGNDKLWYQTIPVNTGQNYTFSFFIQTVAINNPASLETTINGISLGLPTIAPVSTACNNWTLISYVWNSTTSTTAQICIYDRNTQTTGNDFAIDDVSFINTNPTVCNLSNTVTVNVSTLTLTNVPTDFTVCSGAKNIATTFGSNFSAATFSWTNSNPSIGLAALGTGNISNFTFTNATTLPITATIVVNANGTLAGCTSPSQTYTIIVKPLAIVQLADVPICNRISQPAINFTSIIPLAANEEFFWTNDELLVGLPPSGTGNILPFTSSSNNTNVDLIATISVFIRNKNTLVLSDCSMIFKIILSPDVVVLVNNPVHSFGNPNTTITATVNLVDTYLYTWTVPAGFANPGNVSSFDFPPSSFVGTLAAGTYVFSVKVKSTLTNCESEIKPGTYTYGVDGVVSNVSEITINGYSGPDPLNLSSCDADSCTILDASFLDIYATTSYAVNSVPYNFLTFASGTGFNIKPLDDSYSDIQSIFKFSFYNNSFTTAQLGTNVFFKFFNGTGNIPNNNDSGWAFNQTIPSTTLNNEWRNSIYFPMQDTDPSPDSDVKDDDSPAQEALEQDIPISPDFSMVRNTDGLIENKKEVFTVLKLSNYSSSFECVQTSGFQESQLVLYQNTNIIDVNIKKRKPCTTWNSNGSGVLGLHNANGTLATVPLDRNTGPWEATEESWRFTPNGAIATTFEWVDKANPSVVLSTNRSFKVCPTATTTYTARVIYNPCNTLPQCTPIEFKRDVIITVSPDATNSPLPVNNIPNTNNYNIASNKAIILGALPLNSHTIKFYPSLNQAIASIGQITNLSTYVGFNGQVVAVVIKNNATSCVRFKSFLLIKTDATNNGPICAGGTFTLSTPDLSSLGTATYSWTGPNGFTSSVREPVIIDVNGNSAGDYFVTPFVNGVAQVTSFTTPIINALPLINSFSASPAAVCSGTETNIVIEGKANADIVFKDGTTTTTKRIPASGTLTVPTGNLVADTTYEISQITDSATLCEQIYSPVRTVTVTVSSIVNAGTDRTKIVCGNDATPIDLNTVLTDEQFGGTWLGLDVSGSGGTFDAITGIYSPGVVNTTRTFSYSLLGNGACPSDTSLVTVQFTTVPTADLQVNKTTVCRTFASPILTFIGLGGTAPYVFSYTLNAFPQTDITTITGNQVTLPVPTGTLGQLNYCITKVVDANCTNLLTTQICKTVDVLDSPVVLPPSPFKICDDNITADGKAAFNLQTKNAEISTAVGIQITYYSTLVEAQLGTAIPISTALNPLYINTVPFSQTVYARVFDPSSPTCYSTVSLDLIVNPRPTINPLLKPFNICDVTGPLLNDGFETFTLSDKNAEILNGQSGATVRYYFDEPLAEANVSGTDLPNSYTNTTAYSQKIYYTITNTVTGCTTTKELELKVNPIPLAPASFTAYSKCDDLAPMNFEAFDLQGEIPRLLNGQSGVTVTFYPTYDKAVTGLTADIITNTISYPNTVVGPETIGVRLTNNVTKCYTVSTMTLIVLPLPVATFPPANKLVICDSDFDGLSTFDLGAIIPDIINGPNIIEPTIITFYSTEFDAKGGLSANQLPLLYNNSNAFSQNIYVRATNSVTGCFSVIMITIKIDPAPKVPLNPVLPDLTECDDDLVNNQDGKTQIDLTQQNNLLLGTLNTPNSNFDVTYHQLKADASATIGVGAIINPTQYDGSDGEIIWVRIENNITKCYQFTSFNLKVNKPLLLPVAGITPLRLCDTFPSTLPLMTTFDLVRYRNTEILGSALPANFTVAYYTTITNATTFSGLIANPTSYLNTSSPQTLGVIVTNNLTGCKSYTSLTIEVLEIPKQQVPFTPQANIAPTLPEKCDDTLPIGDLKEVFDLTLNSAAILSNNVNVTLHYYPTKPDADATPATNEILTPTAYNTQTTSVWIQVRSNVANSEGVFCYQLIEQPLKVNPLPLLNNLNAATHPGNLYRECQNTPPGLTTFNLSGLEAELNASNAALPATFPATTFSYKFYTSAAFAEAGTPSITNPSLYETTAAVGFKQTIYYSITNSKTNCVNPYGQFEIIVDVKPTINLPTPLEVCDRDGTNDGLVSFPLDNTLKLSIIGTLVSPDVPSNYTVTFYNDKNNAENGTNNITNLADHQAETGSLWIRLENNNTKCNTIGESKQIVEIIPEPVIETDNDYNTICVEFLTENLERGLTLRAKNNKPISGVANSYKWFLEDATGTFNLVGTDQTYEINTAAVNGATRRFKLEMTNIVPSLGCPVETTIFDVFQSGPAVKKAGTIGYFVTNAFESNQTITVTVEGYGTYEYSLDAGDRQESPIFENVSLEDHIITVWDNEGNGNSCDELIIENVSTIDYPHYFTPNGDGINDTWNIVGLKKQTDSKIYIFDREGKLIKQVAPDGQGWDGTRNGYLLPSTDYWFTVDYTEQNLQKQFRSHFSLKR